MPETRFLTRATPPETPPTVLPASSPTDTVLSVPALKVKVRSAVTAEKSRVSLSVFDGSVTVSLPQPSAKAKVLSAALPVQVSSPSPPRTCSTLAAVEAPVAVPACRLNATVPAYPE